MTAQRMSVALAQHNDVAAARRDQIATAGRHEVATASGHQIAPTGCDQATEVARLEQLGAVRIDIGQGTPSWVVMADPEGNEFCVLRTQVPPEGQPFE